MRPTGQAHELFSQIDRFISGTSRWAVPDGKATGMGIHFRSGNVRVSCAPGAFGAVAYSGDGDGAAHRPYPTDSAHGVARLTETFELLADLIRKVGTAGNLTTDAHLAALASERGFILQTTDADFARFAGLKWNNPLK